jgi:hypothetical protein
MALDMHDCQLIISDASSGKLSAMQHKITNGDEMETRTKGMRYMIFSEPESTTVRLRCWLVNRFKFNSTALVICQCQNIKITNHIQLRYCT